MRTTPLRLSKILYLAAILLMGMGLLLGCGTPDASTVRQPQGDVDAFWDQFNWTDLTAAEQSLWQTLGWDESSWQGEADEPASESKLWNELTTEQRTAAEQLGYDQQSWDVSPSNSG